MKTLSPPAVGQRTTVRGLPGTIRKVHAAGTVDVECDSGQWFRVSGLPFTATTEENR